MKKGIVLVLSIFALGSCSPKKEVINKNIYVKEFKLKYFCGCLKYGFNNSPQIKKLFKEDSSGYSELILGEKYLLIDSLTKKIGNKIRKDSITNGIGGAEGGGGKRVFSECLSKYESKWLDSIATANYRQFKKEN